MAKKAESKLISIPCVMQVLVTVDKQHLSPQDMLDELDVHSPNKGIKFYDLTVKEDE